MATFFDTILSYFDFYRSYFIGHWNHMTPEKYGLLLVFIGLFGWFLMKSCIRANR